MREINAKLIKVQQALKAPKNQYNEFNKFNYRNAEDILEAVKPLLAEQGLTLTLSDQMEYIGNRYYIKTTATLSDGVDTITTVAYAREDENRPGMSESQVTGCSSSYARKYCLNGLFLIDDGKDSDAFDNKAKTQPTQVKQVNTNNKETLINFCKEIKPSLNEDEQKELGDFYRYWESKVETWKGRLDVQRLWEQRPKKQVA